MRQKTRQHLALWLCGFALLGLWGCVTPYKVKKIKAHALTHVPSFTLPNTDEKKISIGKPWGKATALVMIRGFW